MDKIVIDGLEIPFDKSWHKIAISLSGGADSALLTYILSDYISSNNLDIKIYTISHIRMWQTRPWQAWDRMRVRDWLKDKFKNLTFEEHVNFVAPDFEYGFIGPSITDLYGKKVSGDNIEIRSFAEYVCHWNGIDAYYNAVTRNPKEIDLNGMKERDVDENEDNKHLRLMKHMETWAIHPFRFTDKSWVIKQYYKHDAIDLLNSTRSCEGEFENIDYKTYKPNQPVPECGTCFWCKERNWAIGKYK